MLQMPVEVLDYQKEKPRHLRDEMRVLPRGECHLEEPGSEIAHQSITQSATVVLS